MMNKPPRVRIATDSISDLPAALADEFGIMVVPATITFGEDTYLEGVNLSREEFYGRLIRYSGLPKTAAPGPGAFAEGFLHIIAENQQAGAPLDAIISLHPPATLSGLYNAAYSGSQMVEGTRIEVVDTGQITMGVGWMAILAAQAAGEGKSVDDILALINDLKGRTRLIAGLETLEWAARSGRVSRLTAAVGNLLAIKPIIKVQDGEITLAERARTHSRQVERVMEIIQALAPFREIAVLHARAPELAEQLASRLAAGHPRQRIVVAEIGCILGSYAGPGAYGIVVIRA
jgi:DegV family protein with EDD domain